MIIKSKDIEVLRSSESYEGQICDTTGERRVKF